jgi:hypothetical protein
LSQIQQVYSVLQEIDRLLADIELKVQNLSGQGAGAVSASIPSLRKELHVISMYTVALERWAGSSTIAGIMNKIQSVQAAILRMYMLINTLETIANIGMGPLGWAMLGANVLGFAIAAQNIAVTWGQ